MANQRMQVAEPKPGHVLAVQKVYGWPHLCLLRNAHERVHLALDPKQGVYVRADEITRSRRRFLTYARKLGRLHELDVQPLEELPGYRWAVEFTQRANSNAASAVA